MQYFGAIVTVNLLLKEGSGSTIERSTESTSFFVMCAVIVSELSQTERLTFALLRALPPPNPPPNPSPNPPMLESYGAIYMYSSTFSGTLQIKKSRVVFLVVVFRGTSMVFGDGILTPTMSVLSAYTGEAAYVSKHREGLPSSFYRALPACFIMVIIFSIQHYGTRIVGFLFAPVLVAWLLCVGGRIYIPVVNCSLMVLCTTQFQPLSLRTKVFLKGPFLYAFKGLAGRFEPSVTVPQGLNFPAFHEVIILITLESETVLVPKERFFYHPSWSAGTSCFSVYCQVWVQDSSYSLKKLNRKMTAA